MDGWTDGRARDARDIICAHFYGTFNLITDGDVDILIPQTRRI